MPRVEVVSAYKESYAVAATPRDRLNILRSLMEQLGWKGSDIYECLTSLQAALAVKEDEDKPATFEYALKEAAINTLGMNYP